MKEKMRERKFLSEKVEKISKICQKKKLFRSKIHFFRDFPSGSRNFNNLTHDFHFFHNFRLGNATEDL